MNITYNDNAKHIGDNIEGDKNVSYAIPQQDMEKMNAAVEKRNISKEDINSLIRVLKDINLSQNDLTTEFAKLSEEMKETNKSRIRSKVLGGVSFTSDMVTLGQVAIGIASHNPGLALPAVLETTKKLVK